MISLEKVEAIERLAAEGRLSQRQIARQVGVSRATVSAILTGYRPGSHQRRQRAEFDEFLANSDTSRCPNCGRLTGVNCLPCRLAPLWPATRLFLASLRLPLLGLELEPEHRERLEQVRRVRRQGGTLPAASGGAPPLKSPGAFSIERRLG